MIKAKPLSIYIHWPFCKSKCPYCDFNSHVRESYGEDAWVDGIIQQLNRYANTLEPRPISTIFFGGGTPSLMHPKSIERILNTIQQLWKLEETCEITCEANPNSIETLKLKEFQKAGINRLSMGIQALNQEDLTFLGRTHSLREAIQAIETGLHIFQRASFDLIYARPNQSIQNWETELKQALAFQPTHLSLYQLTIEPGTAFAKRYESGKLVMPPDDHALDLFCATNEIMKHAGLPAYEVSNYAKPGQACRHNLAYWTYNDYIGVGPGAHGRLTIEGQKYATTQYKVPEKWLADIKTNPAPEHEQLAITLDEIFQEKLIMGLRLYNNPFDIEFINNVPLEKKTLFQQKCNVLRQEGFMDEHAYFLTPKGMCVLNAVCAYLA